MHENLIKNQSFLLITTNVASALKLLEGSLSVSLLSVDLIIHRRRTRHARCQLSILISYFSLQQMEVCPLYFLCISPSEWRLNPREADRLWRSSRGKLGLLRFRKVLGVSVLTAGEATRLMCFFAYCSAHCRIDGWGTCEVLCFSELMKLDKTDPSHCTSGYVGLFEEHIRQLVKDHSDNQELASSGT